MTHYRYNSIMTGPSITVTLLDEVMSDAGHISALGIYSRNSLAEIAWILFKNGVITSQMHASIQPIGAPQGPVDIGDRMTFQRGDRLVLQVSHILTATVVSLDCQVRWVTNG